MRAARDFALRLQSSGVLDRVDRVGCTLYGSLGATGIGHGTPDAVVAGLRGLEPETADPDAVRTAWTDWPDGQQLLLADSRSIPFAKTDIVFALEGSDAPVWTGHAVDDKFENEAGSYVIKGIDFETQSVTVAKTWTQEKKHTVKTESADLRPEVSKKPTPPVSTTKPNEAKSK